VVGTCRREQVELGGVDNFAAPGHTADDVGGQSLEMVLLARPHPFASIGAHRKFVQHILHPEYIGAVAEAAPVVPAKAEQRNT